MMIMTVMVIMMMMLRFPGHTALHTRDRHGADLKWSYEDYMEDVRTAAKGFIALGLERFQTVILIGRVTTSWPLIICR